MCKSDLVLITQNPSAAMPIHPLANLPALQLARVDNASGAAFVDILVKLQMDWSFNLNVTATNLAVRSIRRGRFSPPCPSNSDPKL